MTGLFFHLLDTDKIANGAKEKVKHDLNASACQPTRKLSTYSTMTCIIHIHTKYDTLLSSVLLQGIHRRKPQTSCSNF